MRRSAFCDVNNPRRERPCAVPFDHVEKGVNAEGVKPLPYENNQANVDILAPFRLFVADDYCRERPDAPIKSHRLHLLRLFGSPSARGFLSSSLIPRTAHCTHPLTVRPFPKKLLVLWPLLTSATSACPLEQGYFPARWQTSPGKNADFPCTPALFTVLALGRIGLRCYLPTRPASQPHRVRVPQVAALLPASSRPRLTTTPLPSANGWHNNPP